MNAICRWFLIALWSLLPLFARSQPQQLLAKRYYSHRGIFLAAQSATRPTVGKDWDGIKKKLERLTPERNTVLSRRLHDASVISQVKSGIMFYRPTYFIPYYYTAKVSPWYAEHPGNTPDGLPVKSGEAKGQISLIYPVLSDINGTPWAVSLSYTQVNYWQLWSKTPYFRETNYEPQLLFTYYGLHNWLFSFGLDHESNGRGGTGLDGMERSWNRAFLDIAFSGEHWLVDWMPWVPVQKSYSMNRHNKDIMKYMGYGRLVLAYQFDSGLEFSVMMRNTLESEFKRGALQGTISFPLFKRVRGMIIGFSGYGQSLIEYNHYTNSIGVGLALSDWI